jgi:hypothetical protein
MREPTVPLGSHGGGAALYRFLLLCVLATALPFSTSCGPPERPDEDPAVDGYRLRTSSGTWTDGSGRRGLALLATLRDAQGRGPADAWTASLRDGAGPLAQPIAYDSPGAGSFAAWWWPDLGIAPDEPFTVTLSRAGGAELSRELRGSTSAGLEPPSVELSADGTQLLWAQVPEARSYQCRILASGQLQHSANTQLNHCDLSALPPGTYLATVLASSVDQVALAQDASARPQLPLEFHLSEARLAFAVGNQGGTLRALAAGGALEYGASSPALALWLSLTRADGTPLAEPWSVEVVGPGLPAERPLRFTYPASARRFVVWSYDTPALQGRYFVNATSPAGKLSTQLTLGPAQALGLPSGVSASAQPSGGARVTWAAVPGARTYYVSAWGRDGALASGLWVTRTDALFPAGTFTAGRAYDVYVAATNVDLEATTAPAQVSVSESTFSPSSFTAQ